MPVPTLPPCGLYAITDGPRDDLLDVCARVLEGGARLVQYRDKTRDDARRLAEATRLRELCDRHGVPLIVNDDVELALRCGAAGVHLGEDDGDLASARARLGASAILGVSCYDDIDRARRLAAEGADYLAFGAFFASTTKPLARRATPALLREARAFGKPLVAIGGITPGNAAPLIDAGADFLAIVSAVFAYPDTRAAAHAFASLFHQDPVSTP
ncbi:thiamine phosphate synthase [Dokdonella sp. MW10]|uniref:thiamine phosphate synthase n=1 Tax=Dokdonella sp. MW10 TaxID=2992926 RepID=UPI003F7D5E62